MKALLILAGCLCLAACSPTTGQTPAETVVGTVDDSKRLVSQPGEQSDGYVVFRAADATVPRGGRVCLPVETTGFKELVGFQFTMRFDSAALAFDTLRSFQLPGYGRRSFGTRFADRGYLSSLWTDSGLKGVSVQDGHRIFEVCFTNLMEPGQKTEVRFVDGPTSFEVVDKDMRQYRFVHANGTVESR